MRRIHTALLCLSLASMGLRGEAQERAEPLPHETVGAPSHETVLGDALSARFAACYAAEGAALSPADLTVVRNALMPRAVAVAQTAGGADCAATSNQAACVDALTNATCERLARILGDAPGARSSAPSWAAGYARVLAQRVAACYVAESDGGSLDEARETLTRFERETADALGALSERQGCHADQDFLPACSTSVMALSCGDLGSRLANEPASMLRALGGACERLVACEGDGGAGLAAVAATAITQ